MTTGDPAANGPPTADHGRGSRVPWRRISAEAVAIVASILLAFAIDAWWDASRERQREHDVLVALRAEFEANRARLESIRAAHERTHAAAAALMTLSDGGVAAPSDSIETLLGRVFIDAYSYNPSTGALDGLVASGDLGIVRNDELRGLLASWTGQIEENAEDEAWVFRDVQEVYTPYLNRILPTRGLWLGGTDLPPPSRRPDYGAVLGRDDFESLVGMRAYGARILVEENDALMMLILRVLELIDGELARGAGRSGR